VVCFLAGERDFSLLHSVQGYSQPHIASNLMGDGTLIIGRSGHGMKLTTHLHPLLRLRIYGAAPTVPAYIFMSQCLIKHRVKFFFYV
jgi:hypothetical protein